jgi:GTPase SAR1 family protein
MRHSDHECQIPYFHVSRQPPWPSRIGKTAILKSLCNEDPSETSPTPGFNVKTIHLDSFKFNVYDIGGQREVPQYWDNYYKNT